MGLPTEAGTTSSIGKFEGKKKKNRICQWEFLGWQVYVDMLQNPTHNKRASNRQAVTRLHATLVKGWKIRNCPLNILYILWRYHQARIINTLVFRNTTEIPSHVCTSTLCCMSVCCCMQWGKGEQRKEQQTFASSVWKLFSKQFFYINNIYISFCGWRRAVHTRVACIHESCARKMAGRWKLTRLHMKKLPRGSVIERVPAFVRLHSSSWALSRTS